MWPQDEDKMDQGALDRRSMFLATTSIVILFTVFVQGGLTHAALAWLGIEVRGTLRGHRKVVLVLAYAEYAPRRCSCCFN